MPRGSWKWQLGKHGPGFLQWAEGSQIHLQTFFKLAADLERFLLEHVLVSREACQAFVSRVPDVMKRCDEDIYDEPWAAPAYAYVHLLERYRRFWHVLVELTRARVLPMGDDSIDVLDVGTGPAPALYAVADFYDAILGYAVDADVPRLATPPPNLESVESSKGMMSFVHVFSELARRNGPFSATFLDFRGLMLPRERQMRVEQQTRQIADELDTSEEFARWWMQENETWWHDVFRYNLCIFSNFLTQASTVGELRNELGAVFRSLRLGGVVLVVGGTGGHYPEIYEMVDRIAHETGTRPIDWMPESLPCVYGDDTAQRIKRLYRRVWRRLEEYCGDLTYICESLPRDLWEPNTPLRGPTRFGLRVFRKGRW